jgi:hypothetical protein
MALILTLRISNSLTTMEERILNEEKSAASFYHQVAVFVPDMFCNFYLVKNNKIANNSATTEAREKISTY